MILLHSFRQLFRILHECYDNTLLYRLLVSAAARLLSYLPPVTGDDENLIHTLIHVRMDLLRHISIHHHYSGSEVPGCDTSPPVCCG